MILIIYIYLIYTLELTFFYRHILFSLVLSLWLKNWRNLIISSFKLFHVSKILIIISIIWQNFNLFFKLIVAIHPFSNTFKRFIFLQIPILFRLVIVEFRWIRWWLFLFLHLNRVELLGHYVSFQTSFCTISFDVRWWAQYNRFVLL